MEEIEEKPRINVEVEPKLHQKVKMKVARIPKETITNVVNKLLEGWVKE